VIISLIISALYIYARCDDVLKLAVLRCELGRMALRAEG
jgi:hypothetical protein